MIFFQGLGITIVTFGVLIGFYGLFAVILDGKEVIAAAMVFLALSVLIGIFFTDPQEFGYIKVDEANEVNVIYGHHHGGQKK